MKWGKNVPLEGFLGDISGGVEQGTGMERKGKAVEGVVGGANVGKGREGPDSAIKLKLSLY
jgi:hypothetical protein